MLGQNQWSKQVMENPYSLSCVQVGPGPRTQTLESKPRLGKLTVFCVLVKVHLQILCKIGSQNKAWETCTFMCSNPGPCTNSKVCSAQNPLAKKQGLENLLCFLCPGQGPHTDPKVGSAQNPFAKKKQGLETLPSFLCTEQGPHTDPNVCSAQNPLSKKQGLENLPCFLCPGHSLHTDPNVCSAQNPLSKKIKDRKTYLVSCVLVKVHTPILMCDQHKPLWPKKQGLENLPCFLCPGQGPHTDPRAFLAQTLWWEHGGCWGLGSPPARTEIHPLAASFC